MKNDRYKWENSSKNIFHLTQTEVFDFPFFVPCRVELKDRIAQNQKEISQNRNASWKIGEQQSFI